MPTRRLLLIKTGSTFPELRARYGDFEAWIVRALPCAPDDVAICDATAPDGVFPSPDQIAGVIITGSHAMVTEHRPWSERLARWIRGLVEQRIPVFGICYGHQLLAYALGGVVGDNPNGREFGSPLIHLTEAAAADPLFRDLPAQFAAHVCHTQSVLQLPPGATVLARNAGDPHQAFVVSGCAWGVQFHPEFSVESTRQYIRAFAAVLRDEGHNPDDLLRQCRPTPHSTALLKKFQTFIDNSSTRSQTTAMPTRLPNH